MDQRSKKASHFENDPGKLEAALKFVETHPGMHRPVALKEAADRSNDYVAVYIPGGHAPMNDLFQDRDLGKILRDFHRAGKTTAALCHGPVALLAALPNASAYARALVAGDQKAMEEAAVDWPYAGYRMTVFSTSEEKTVEKNVFRGRVRFYVAEALAAAGGRLESATNFKPSVVQDRELVTGQNPASARGLAEAVLKALSERKSKAVA